MEILNRKARYDYEIEDTYEAGIVLTGTEIKSIREGKVNIKDSYAIIRNNEIYLLNTHISTYKEGNIFNHEEDRTRKLLLHKKEILKLRDKLEVEGVFLAIGSTPNSEIFNVNKDNNYIILEDQKTYCSLSHKSLSKKTPEGVGTHGGCTPEEVLVPIFFISS